MMTIRGGLARCAALCGAVLWSAAALGQSLQTLPPSYDTVAGTSANSLPIANYTSGTHQVMYGANQLTGIPVGSVITGMQLRLRNVDGAFPGATFVASQYDVRLAGSALTPATMSTTYATNMTNPVLVRSGSLTVAAGAYPGTGNPRAWGPVIPFTTGYAYKGGPLVIEWRVTSPSNTFNAYADVDTDASLNRYLHTDNNSSATTASFIDAGGPIVRLTFTPAAADLAKGVTKVIMPESRRADVELCVYSGSDGGGERVRHDRAGIGLCGDGVEIAERAGMADGGGELHTVGRAVVEIEQRAGVAFADGGEQCGRGRGGGAFGSSQFPDREFPAQGERRDGAVRADDCLCERVSLPGRSAALGGSAQRAGIGFGEFHGLPVCGGPDVLHRGAGVAGTGKCSGGNDHEFWMPDDDVQRGRGDEFALEPVVAGGGHVWDHGFAGVADDSVGVGAQVHPAGERDRFALAAADRVCGRWTEHRCNGDEL